MTNVVPVDPDRRPVIVSGARIHPIVPATLEDAFRIGKAIFQSGTAPYSFKSADAVCAAVMYGLEIGLPPMQAIQSIAIINGKPAIFGDAAIALVRASGLLATFRERVEGEGDDRAGVCHVSRRNPDGSIEEIEERFTVRQAKVAGLWDKRGKNGEATPWQTYPDRMLRFRARGFALRDLFADVLKGLHTVEEAEDEGRAIAPPTPPTPPAPPTEKPNPPVQQHIIPAELSPPAPRKPPTPPSGRSTEPYAGPPADEAKPERDWLADFENDLSSATSAAGFDEIAGPYLEELGSRSMAERTKAQAIYEKLALKWSEIAP